jgi:hypothetical protein
VNGFQVLESDKIMDIEGQDAAVLRRGSWAPQGGHREPVFPTPYAQPRVRAISGTNPGFRKECGKGFYEPTIAIRKSHGLPEAVVLRRTRAYIPKLHQILRGDA